MGYRLNIHKLEKGESKNIFYGTKYYGYEDLTDSLSYMYLISIGKLEKDEYFNYGSNQQFALNKKEFTIFCYLYNIDYEKVCKKYLDNQGENYFLNCEEIKNELMDDINDYDNEIYIISWC